VSKLQLAAKMIEDLNIISYKRLMMFSCSFMLLASFIFLVKILSGSEKGKIFSMLMLKLQLVEKNHGRSLQDVSQKLTIFFKKVILNYICLLYVTQESLLAQIFDFIIVDVEISIYLQKMLRQL
jgi:hypothetical protein